MLGCVGQSLGDDEVRHRFQGLGEAALHPDVELDRKGGAAGKRLQRRPETTLGQDRRVDAPHVLAELVGRAREPGGHVVEPRPEIGELRGHYLPRSTQLKDQRDEPLLRAVVEVALDPPPRLILGPHDPSTRRRQLEPAPRHSRSQSQPGR